MSNATWSGLIDGFYNDAANWNFATPPSSGQTGTFNNTAHTFSLYLPVDLTVGGFTINSGSFELDTLLNHFLSFDGDGIIINGGSLLIAARYGASFSNNSSAGSATIELTGAAGLSFLDNSIAGDAKISSYDDMSFYDFSNADHATINNYAVPGGTTSGLLQFQGSSSAGSATVNNYGTTFFTLNATASTALITTEENANTSFFQDATAADATITTKSGGLTRFFDSSNGGQARFITEAGGVVNFGNTGGPLNGLVHSHQITAGSIEGAGNYVLGQNELTVGGNDFSTIVSGNISGDGGSLVKVGTGSLKLSGNNTFDAGITLQEGTLDFASLKAAGNGDVTFLAGAQNLTIEKAALSGGTFANHIYDFGIGDTIELVNLKFVKGATKITYNATTDLLTVKSGKVVDKTTLANPETNFFKIVKDGNHVDIVITATQARPHHNNHSKVVDHDDRGHDFHLDGRGGLADHHDLFS